MDELNANRQPNGPPSDVERLNHRFGELLLNSFHSVASSADRSTNPDTTSIIALELHCLVDRQKTHSAASSSLINDSYIVERDGTRGGGVGGKAAELTRVKWPSS